MLFTKATCPVSCSMATIVMCMHSQWTPLAIFTMGKLIHRFPWVRGSAWQHKQSSWLCYHKLWSLLLSSPNNQNVFCLIKMLLVSERFHANMVSCVLYSSAKKPWGSWSAFSGHVELCDDPLGACHKRSAFWTLVSNGSRHEGEWLIYYWIFISIETRMQSSDMKDLIV